MDTTPRRRLTLAGGVGQTKGNEFVQATGYRLYINHTPHFTVEYNPTTDPEEVCYREWENQVILYGWHLQPYYEHLKANGPDTIAVSPGPYDPADAQPYLQRWEHRLRL